MKESIRVVPVMAVVLVLVLAVGSTSIMGMTHLVMAKESSGISAGCIYAGCKDTSVDYYNNKLKELIGFSLAVIIKFIEHKNNPTQIPIIAEEFHQGIFERASELHSRP